MTMTIREMMEIRAKKIKELEAERERQRQIRLEKATELLKELLEESLLEMKEELVKRLIISMEDPYQMLYVDKNINLRNYDLKVITLADDAEKRINNIILDIFNEKVKEDGLKLEIRDSYSVHDLSFTLKIDV